MQQLKMALANASAKELDAMMPFGMSPEHAVPANASSPANISPVGPASTIITSSSRIGAPHSMNKKPAAA